MNDFTSQPMQAPTAPTPSYLPDLLNRLQGKHPVILFGTQESGKTLVLVSLFHYAKRGSDADFTVALGKDILPPNAPGARDRTDYARGFFDLSVEELMRQKEVVGTQIPSGQPIYFPIDVTISADAQQDLATVEFAILDGMGEWFGRDPSDTIKAHKLFPEEIAYILRRYTDPISAIFLVPATGPEYQDDELDMHSAMSKAIDRYQELRLMHEDDNVLLLATKWDKLYPPNRVGGDFAEASPQLVIRSLSHIGLAWKAFKTMKNVPENSRSIMQYSSAWMDGRAILKPHEKAIPIFERYSRTLWNWLFGNAKQATSKGVRARPILFDDVEAPKLRKPGVFERMVYSLVGVDTRNGI